MTLRRSERVELIELDDGFSDGWFLGKHLTRGGTGLFPGGILFYLLRRQHPLIFLVYTTRAPPSLRTPPHSRNVSAHLAARADEPKPNNAVAASAPRPLSNTQPPTFASSNTDLEYSRASLPAPQHHSTYVQRTIGEALGENDKSKDSPVMNETLNSIEEHITDLSTPRQSQAVRRHRDDSESEYSTHLDRHSFLSGPETDEEDNNTLEEAQVRSWDHNQTAQYLEEIGLDPAHCQIFREQEITGDVLLDMDQSFIYMKEYDFGVMGKRLKTWHKVRDFQREVKATSSKRTSDRGQHSSLEDIDRSAVLSMSGPSPLGRSQDRGLYTRQSQPTLAMHEDPAVVPHPLQPQQPQQPSKRASWTAQTPPSSWRANQSSDSPVGASNSNSRHSRRHSSIDFGAHPDLDLSSLPSTSSHKKQSSWSLAGSTTETTPSSSIRPSTKADDRTALGQSPLDVDRGYFSGNDIDNHKTRNKLSKSPRASHSRQTSMTERSNRTSMVKRHARLSSVGSVRDQSALGPFGAPKAYHEIPVKGRLRSASARATSGASSGGLSPAVTNLENDSSPNMGSPAIEKKKIQDRARKLIGFRTTSEAVTSEEKTNANKFAPVLDSSDFVASPVTGNTTPSATPSIDMETPEDSVRGSDTPQTANRNTFRPRPLTKQYTSAYTHGLLKIPPSEARKQCDYHGWMKKKSSGIMSSWKPRLFILRGRRLSYYYSEDDTEERGIIDISSHKVLVANDDPMITIHASVTGATKPTSTPRTDPSASPTKPRHVDVFYFKLLPPKSGLSRAVQFTKPSIHYFQVETISEGRKWMGEIMKATIEHDLTSFETTNKQKTISLAKARARKERPPELDDTKKLVEEEKVDDEKTLRQSGLMIQGLGNGDTTKTGTTLNQSSELEATESNPMKVTPTLGLEPRVSLIPKKEDLVDTIPEEENRENAEVLPLRTSGTTASNTNT